jgi:hypothetical protein
MKWEGEVSNQMPREEKEKWSSGDFLAGVIDDHNQVEAALDELDSEGIPKDTVRIFHGQSGSEELGNIGGTGLWGLIRRGLEDYIGNVKFATDRHKEEAERGHYVMLVELPDSTMEHRAYQILKLHGGHHIVARAQDTYKTFES